MKFTILLLALLLCVGCVDKSTIDELRTSDYTFPVNEICESHVQDYLGTYDGYTAEYEKFTTKLDAYPSISGFVRLSSQGLMSFELHKVAIKILDGCFARAKSIVPISSAGDWRNVGESVQFFNDYKIPIHSIVIQRSEVEIYFNYQEADISERTTLDTGVSAIVQN